jgi:hypothetical protein
MKHLPNSTVIYWGHPAGIIQGNLRMFLMVKPKDPIDPNPGL